MARRRPTTSWHAAATGGRLHPGPLCPTRDLACSMPCSRSHGRSAHGPVATHRRTLCRADGHVCASGRAAGRPLLDVSPPDGEPPGAESEAHPELDRDRGQSGPDMHLSSLTARAPERTFPPPRVNVRTSRLIAHAVPSTPPAFHRRPTESRRGLQAAAWPSRALERRMASHC